MRLDLLWWRHLRKPRAHVAEPRVVDMNALIMNLVPFESPLTAMLMRLDGQWVTLDEEVSVGSYLVHEGKWRKAYKVERQEPDDWFEPTRWRVQVREATRLGTEHGTVHWLEDELFQRVGRVESSDNPVFRKGDIVNIIGGGR